jgi:putative transposase
MARLSRIVIPHVAHHITQRGNRRLPIFFGDDDRAAYLELVAAACSASGTRCAAWCLMDNHVHLILIPETADGLRAALGEAHRRYTRRRSRRGSGPAVRSPSTSGSPHARPSWAAHCGHSGEGRSRNR